VSEGLSGLKTVSCRLALGYYRVEDRSVTIPALVFEDFSMKLNSYLIFDGCCADAFRFYERVLGASRLTLFTFGDSPMASGTPEGWQDKIVHARLEIGGEVLMGSDGMPGQHEKARGFSVSIQVADPATAEPIFLALAEGGTVRMPFQKTYWSAGFGMLVDRFGTPWMVNCEQPAASAGAA
jgi:PhnB protein